MAQGKSSSHFSTKLAHLTSETHRSNLHQRPHGTWLLLSLSALHVKLEGRVMVRAHLHTTQATSEVCRPPAPPHSLTLTSPVWRSRHRFAFYEPNPHGGMGIPSAHNARAALTLGKDNGHFATTPRARSGGYCAHIHRFRSSSGTGRQTLRPRERDRDRDRAHLPRVGTP